MKGIAWTKSFSILIILTFIFLQAPVAGGEEGPEKEIELWTGPLLWTHLGPMPITYIDDVFSLENEPSTEYWIIQFNGPISDNIEQTVNSHGPLVLDYFPDFGFVVKLNGFPQDQLESIPGVIGSTPFPTGLKVSPDLLMDLENGDDIFSGFDSMTIETFTTESIRSELFDLGLNFVQTKETRYVVQLPIFDLHQLMGIDGVKWIEPRSEMAIRNNVADGIIDVDLVWDSLGLDGTGQMVGIADTGLDTGVDNHGVDGDIHLDIDNRATITDWSGSGPDDENGHGTHVTGSVAGSGARSDGNIKGMAYNSSVYFQALETDGGWLNTPSNLSTMFTQAYNGGARIHTNSWGSQLSSLWGAYTAECYDVDWSMFTSSDLLILFAAGNDGNDGNSDGKVDQNSVSPPATSKSTLTVGASENLRGSGGFQATWGMGWPADFPVNPLNGDRASNNSYGLAAFSSRGPLDDGRLKPEVVAPGTNILSMKTSLTGNNIGWGAYNSTYVYFGGTSMSTPITAGMAALVREYYNVTLGIGSPTAALLKATIINGATDITPGQYGGSNPTTQEVNRRPDMDQGWGRINLKDSVDPDGKTLTFIDNSSGIATGENLTRMFRVISSDEELRLTLSWSDYPGSLFAGKQLINDLDLILYAPNGTIYRGNDFTAPFDDATDSINPTEGIVIKDPSVGWWKVVVEGSNIPRGPQHYALVGTGNMTPFIQNMMFLDREYYSTSGAEVFVSLTSKELSGMGSISIYINSTTDPIGKNITILEEGDFGAFRGSFFTSNTSTSEANEIFVSHDDQMNVEYISPLAFTFNARATAKRPMMVNLVQLPENRLIYSRYDDIRLKGYGDPGLDVFWTVPGSNMPWIGIYDDGHLTHGDEIADDGEYNVDFYMSSSYDADGNISLRVDDPFLGPLYYEQFSIVINSSRPGAPSDLEAVPVSTGNTVLLKWTRSNSLSVHHHDIYLNATSTPPDLDPSGWLLVKSTDDPYNTTDVTGLVDGIEYNFRVAAVNTGGNSSSPSFWDSAVPHDIVAPTITYEGVPEVLSGTAILDFESDDDLELLQVQYYHDINGDGLENDNSTYLEAVNSSESDAVWDTREHEDMERIILRWRGDDEVPNRSNWTYRGGFGIDNTGPLFLELSTFPPRVTNGTNFNLIGTTEPLAVVTVVLNGVEIEDLTAGMNGLFDLNIDLVEGENILNLSAIDLHGAGPTYASYIFTKDSQDPVAVIRGINESIEIRCNCTSFVSDSFDQGSDPLHTSISNFTWKLTGPFGATSLWYGQTFEKVFDQIGQYQLLLRVEDEARNWDEDNITFRVVDLTPPTANISGPLIGNEDTTYTYSIEGSTDNDPTLFESKRALVEWTFTGPNDYLKVSERYDPSILFPDPGLYSISLRLSDAQGNIDINSVEVEILDITPPEVELIGNRIFDLDERETFNLSIDDNHPEYITGSTYLWTLYFLDSPVEDMVATSSLSSLDHTFSQAGNYSLKVVVTDPAGNSRNQSMQLLVKAPRIIDTPKGSEEGGIPMLYFAFAAGVLLIILLIVIFVAIARRREYDEVDSEWEEDEDLDEYDDIDEDEEEVDWDDDEDWDEE